jgi:hypothetical protein
VFCGSTSTAAIDHTIVAWGTGGGGIDCLPGANVTIECTNVYGNVGGDWLNAAAPFDGVSGNTTLDPLFCDPMSEDGLYLAMNSPCNVPADPSCDYLGALPAECPAVTTVPHTTVPLQALLRHAMPNPFTQRTRFTYELPDLQPRDRISLTIYNAAGRRVRELTLETQGPGVHNVIWNGLDDAGRRVASGVYYAQLVVGAEKTVQRLVRLR